MTDLSGPQAAAERFFTAFYSGDIEGTRAAVTEDFKLEGPFATANTVDELLQLAEGLMAIARGHKVLSWMTDGDRVSVLYHIVLSGPGGREGLLTTGGWFTAVDGRLAHGRVIYDSAEFDAITEPS
jgi:hypothetical protein